MTSKNQSHLVEYSVRDTELQHDCILLAVVARNRDYIVERCARIFCSLFRHKILDLPRQASSKYREGE